MAARSSESQSAMLKIFRDRDASPLRNMVPWAGEFAGQYLTGAVEVLRVTGDTRLKTWLKEFVTNLISLQDEDGYIGPWTQPCRLTNKHILGTCTWDTWGHYHIMMGLMHWHDQTKDKDALTSACRIVALL